MDIVTPWLHLPPLRCTSAYEFWKIAGLSQAIVYRLNNNLDAFLPKETQDATCKAFNAQPEDFLCYLEALGFTGKLTINLKTSILTLKKVNDFGSNSSFKFLT
jgi:DNA-binding Xre family transcriptional regulator